MCLHIYAERWIRMLQWQVDYTRRSLVAKNHTATHILNYALRQVLGEKVDQKGSLVTEDKLRFDFSHGKPVELKELKKIEEICNQMIQKSCVIHFRDVALDTAKAITGLRDLAQRVIVSPWRLPKPPPPLLRGLWMLVGEGVVGNEEWGGSWSAYAEVLASKERCLVRPILTPSVWSALARRLMISSRIRRQLGAWRTAWNSVVALTCPTARTSHPDVDFNCPNFENASG